MKLGRITRKQRIANDGHVVQHLEEFGRVSKQVTQFGIEIQKELLVMLLSSLPTELDYFALEM